MPGVLFLSAFEEELMVCLLPGCSKDVLFDRTGIPNHSEQVVQITETTPSPEIDPLPAKSTEAVENNPGKTEFRELQSSGLYF